MSTRYDGSNAISSCAPSYSSGSSTLLRPAAAPVSGERELLRGKVKVDALALVVGHDGGLTNAVRNGPTASGIAALAFFGRISLYGGKRPSTSRL